MRSILRILFTLLALALIIFCLYLYADGFGFVLMQLTAILYITVYISFGIFPALKRKNASWNMLRKAMHGLAAVLTGFIFLWSPILFFFGIVFDSSVSTDKLMLVALGFFTATFAIVSGFLLRNIRKYFSEGKIQAEDPAGEDVPAK